jgi:hypothetical protein
VNGFRPPVIVAPPGIAAAVESICAPPDALEALEESARAEDLEEVPLLASGEWARFAGEVQRVSPTETT